MLVSFPLLDRETCRCEPPPYIRRVGHSLQRCEFASQQVCLRTTSILFLSIKLKLGMSSQSPWLSHCLEQPLVRGSKDGSAQARNVSRPVCSVPYGHYHSLMLEPQRLAPGKDGSSVSTLSQALTLFAAAWVSVPGAHAPCSARSRSPLPHVLPGVGACFRVAGVQHCTGL